MRNIEYQKNEKLKEHPKKAVKIAIIVIAVILITIISTILFYIYNKNAKIDYVINETSDVQDNIENIDSLDDLYVKIDGKNVLGVIQIDKINYKGLIYESTNMDVLDKGIGHFESSPIFNGNVCLAGHNYFGIWKDLYTLKTGDTIKYTCVLGSKEYNVLNVQTINYDDISVLDNTKDNEITLITCIKNTPTKRLCVQAKEI